MKDNHPELPPKNPYETPNVMGDISELSHEQLQSMVKVLWGDMQQKQSELAITEEELHTAQLQIEALLQENSELGSELNAARIINWSIGDAFTETSRDAKIDELTALYGRKEFERLHAVLHETASRKRKFYGVLFIDLDNFKRINDALGHREGDAVLKKVGAIILSNVEKNIGEGAAKGRSTSTKPYNLEKRNDDESGSRIGGDEFVILVPLFGSATAKDAEERLTHRSNTINEALKNGFEGDTKITDLEFGFSIGQSLFDPSSYLDPREILARADRDMYDSKARNKRP